MSNCRNSKESQCHYNDDKSENEIDANIRPIETCPFRLYGNNAENLPGYSNEAENTDDGFWPSGRNRSIGGDNGRRTNGE